MPVMPNCLIPYAPDIKSIPIILVNGDDLLKLDKALGFTARATGWISATGYKATHGELCLLPDDAGNISAVLVGCDNNPNDPGNNGCPWVMASAAEKLPAGQYHLEKTSENILYENDILYEQACFSWVMASYTFEKYKSDSKTIPILVLKEGYDDRRIIEKATAAGLVRDLVNTPAEHMGPFELEQAARELSNEFDATVNSIIGQDLITNNYPALYAVGRAAKKDRAPRLIELNWGDEGPVIVLVGKGICFDTGGLNIKVGTGMRNMKKDMGGGAHVLGLARLIMSTGLPVQLKVIIPAADNALDASALRPGDIIKTRKGLSVEIGNTDAEGRLVLCDGLTRASEHEPDLIIDFATLTGAARVALGPDLPATYTNSDHVWTLVNTSMMKTGDPLWRMPLWPGYDKQLNGQISDLCNISDSGLAGSITAALYLQRFIEPKTLWIHLDIFAWNLEPRPGKPKGAAAQGLFTIHDFIQLFINRDLL